MVSIESLLETPLPWQLGTRVMPERPTEIVRVALAEDLAQSQALDRGALVVLTRATVESAGGYQFDVFVRQAIQRGAAAIVVRSTTAHSMTAEALAARGGVAILEIDVEVDPASLVDELATVVAGDARAALRQLGTAAAVRPEDEVDPVVAVARLAEACGVGLEYEPGATGGGPLVSLDGAAIGVVRAMAPGDIGAIASRLAADAASAAVARREQLVVLPVRTTSAALSQLLLCSQANVPLVAARAADVGLAVAGWHCAARLVVEDPSGDVAVELPRMEEELVGLVAEQVAPSDAGAWSVARPDDSVVLVRTTRYDSQADAPRKVLDWTRVLVDAIRGSTPGLSVRVGVATAHQGPVGLRVSAEESRTALAAARLSDDVVSFSSFDALGVRRMLAEWLTTDAARDTVRDLLAPLDALGASRSAVGVTTLHAYLDEQGSLQRAADRLHVHRNAVVYRLDRIKALGIDYADPDNRFALQLACRARLMTLSRSD